MKTLLKVMIILLVLLGAVAVLVPMIVSTDDITNTIANQVEKATGRTLVVEGEKSLSVIPSLALQLNRVRLSNMASGSRADMATIESLDVHIPWLSLLSKKLSVDKFVVKNPDILLEVDAAGNANWDLFPKADSTPANQAAPTEGSSLPTGFDVSLGKVAIYGGRVRLLDHGAETEQAIEALDLEVSLPSLQQALALNGEVTWMGEILQLSLNLTTPADLMAARSVAVEFGLESRLVDMEYNGTISEGGKQIDGSIALTGQSVKALADWQGIELEGSDSAYNKFSLAGDMQFNNSSLKIKGFEAVLDDLKINGGGALHLSDTPKIVADIDLGMLNVNPYLPAKAVSTSASTAKPDASEQPPAQAMEWDDTPVDLSGLSAVNADIDLRASGLQVRDIKLGENKLKLKLQSGKLDIELSKFSAYEGTGKGNVSVDARRKPYSLNASFGLSGINAQPLLTDAIGFDKLLGSGQLLGQLQTRGVSQKNFVNALAGTVGFKFFDGAIKGANIAAMVRTAKGLLEGDASALGHSQGYDEAQQTDFSELGGKFTFNKGVGRNSDLAMASPLLRLSGEGKVDLPKAFIDYALTVRLVDSLEGQGAVDEAKGVAVPVSIKGPFDKVKIKLDTKKAVEDKVKDTIKNELLKRFGKKTKE